MKLASRLFVFAAILTGPCLTDARAGFSVDITFTGLASDYSSYLDEVTAGIQAAAADWGSKIVSSGVMSLQVNITDDPSVPRANGGSAYTTFVGTDGGLSVWQQGALTAITTGSTAGGGFDAIINIGVNYLVNELWFDPDPVSRVAVVPLDRTDAQSVFLHEFGHILFMNGWRHWLTGELPGDYGSTFDQHVTTDGSTFYFDGERANALYGGPVPLTSGNIMHIGNAAPDPGSDLLSDLMNGVVFHRGSRYYISELDLAIAVDTGILLYGPNVVPEPSTMALLGIGILIVGARWRVVRRAA